MLKKIVDNILNVELFKITFIIMAFFYAFPFTAQITGKIIKIFILWGMVIFIKDLIEEKNIIKNKKNILLFALMGVITIGVLVNYKMKLIPNIITLTYMGIELLILTYVDRSKTKESMFKSISVQLNTIVMLTMLFSIASLIIYVFDIKGSVYNGYYELIIGNFEGRLWGIYGNPNTLGQFGIISVISSMYLIFSNKENKKIKIYNYVNLIIQAMCIVLANSRSTIVAILVASVVFFLIKIIQKSKNDKETVLEFFSKNKFKVISKTCMCIVILFLSLKGIKVTMAILPNITSLVNFKFEMNMEETLDKVKRKSNGSDVSNGRISIWYSGVKAFSESPMFGVGSENVNERTIKYLPKDIVEESPKISSNMHNVYLQVLVSHGIIAFICFVTYICVWLFKACKYIVLNKIEKNNDVYNKIFFLMLIVISMLTINLFDSNILYFFSLFMVAVFWSTVGNIDKLIDSENENKSKKKKSCF